MNYQHAYHAGNFADVIKHSLLTLLLQHLHKKDTPYVYIDTHAGAGVYDLHDPKMQKTAEYQNGVQKLSAASKLPNIIRPYLDLLTPDTYPGSPEIAYAFRREQDSLILNEAHSEVYTHLKQHFYRKPGLAIHQRDAYEFLPAILPPREKRGLVLIDPPFEKTTEFEDINACLQKALRKWPTGIYMIWSPITGRTHPNPGGVALRNIQQPSIQLDFLTTPVIPKISGLVGCRHWIINPPFQFESEARALLKQFGSFFSTQK